MYHITPFRYLFEGFLVAVVHDVPVECADNELARFTPPQGQTCQQYTEQFIQRMGGYVREQNGMCEFCQYANGDQFVSASPISLDLQKATNHSLTQPYRRRGSTHSTRRNGWTLGSRWHSAYLTSPRSSFSLGFTWVVQESSRRR